MVLNPSSSVAAVSNVLATMIEETTVIGAVGPLTSRGVPPPNAATVHKTNAPIKPAAAPSPDSTPKCHGQRNCHNSGIQPAEKIPPTVLLPIVECKTHRLYKGASNLYTPIIELLSFILT